MLTYEEVDAVLRYDSQDGKLYWKFRGRDLFDTKRAHSTWNAVFAGKQAFTAVHKSGYHHGSLLGTHVRAARVTWLLCCGEWPKHTIDHFDKNSLNDRIENLRDVPQSVNARNKSMQKNNKSGVNGVRWIENAKCWQAQIGVGGYPLILGMFDSLEEAAAARAQANVMYGYNTGHGAAR